MSCDTPCPQCPFARTTPKNYLDTMGQNSERFAGQALGPFSLPCHMTKKFKEWHNDPTNQTPCVGAAIYRTNCNYQHLNGSLPLLPKDTEKVFASPAELIAHHEGTTVEKAVLKLRRRTLMEMLATELSNAKNVFFKKPTA